MNRVVPNAAKLFLLCLVWLGILAFTAWLFWVHYAGIAEGLALLRLDTQPLDRDALAGGLFTALAPGADFAHLLASVIAFVVLAGTALVASLAFRFVRLAVHAPEELRAGNGVALRRALVTTGLQSILMLILVVTVVRFDGQLFVYRGLVGISGIDDPLQATGSVVALNAQPAEVHQLASIQLIGAVGFWGYIAVALILPIMLEILGSRIGETWAILQEAAAEGRRTDEQGTTHYGYDADGNPVFDPDTPITYDVNQQPVQRSADAAPVQPAPAEEGPAPSPAREAEAPASSSEAVAEPASVEAVVNKPRRFKVLGGAEGETITLAEARRRKDAFHIERPDKVYTRAFWAELNGNPASSAKEAA